MTDLDALASYDRLAALGPPEPTGDECPDCGGPWDAPNNDCPDCGLTGGGLETLPLRYEVTIDRETQLVPLPRSRHRKLRAAQLVAARTQALADGHGRQRGASGILYLVRDSHDPERGDLTVAEPRDDDA